MYNFIRRVSLIIILIISINLNSQESYSKVIYKKKSTVDLKKAKNNNLDAASFLNNVFKKMNKLEYVLLFKNNKSTFKEISKLNFDEEENSLSTSFSKSMGGGEGVYFTNRTNNEIYQQKGFENELFLIKLNTNNDWNLTQETKLIGVYTCFKATKQDYFVGSSGNKVQVDIIAWYTPDIPYSFGPLHYNGLPGLIVELQNNKTIFYAKEIRMNIKEKINISKPKKGIVVTQKRFDSIVMGLAKTFRKRYKRN